MQSDPTHSWLRCTCVRGREEFPCQPFRASHRFFEQGSNVSSAFSFGERFKTSYVYKPSGRYTTGQFLPGGSQLHLFLSEVGLLSFQPSTGRASLLNQPGPSSSFPPIPHCHNNCSLKSSWKSSWRIKWTLCCSPHHLCSPSRDAVEPQQIHTAERFTVQEGFTV